MNNKDLAVAMCATNYCRTFAQAHGKDYDLLTIACAVSIGKCPFKKKKLRCYEITTKDWLEAFKEGEEKH